MGKQITNYNYNTSASEIATLSCTRSLEIGMLFGSSLQGCSLDFSKGTHNFVNLSAPPPPSPLTPLPPATTFSRYINPACRCAFTLLLSKYIGPPMNHAWPRWKPTFGCKKEKSSLFPKKNIPAKQAELKEFVKLMCCVFRFFFLFFFFFIYLLFSDSSLFIV